MNEPEPRRPAAILRMPAEHQTQARARLLVRRIVAEPRTVPRGPVRNGGGWFAPRPKKDPAA